MLACNETLPIKQHTALKISRPSFMRVFLIRSALPTILENCRRG